MERHVQPITTLSLPVPISVVQINRLVVLSTPGSGTFFFLNPFFFSQCMVLSLQSFTVLSNVVRILFRSIYIMKKLSILVWLYHSAKHISLSGYFEQIYILDLVGVASILQRGTLVLEKVKGEIRFRSLNL